MSAGLEIGLGLVIISLILVIPVLVVVAMRRLPQGLSSSPESLATHIPPDNLNTNEAILIIQAGGRVDYVNSLARQWFGLSPDEPVDLELLVRRSRPAEELLNLFATQGQKRLSISGRLVEATSYQLPGPYPVMFVILRNAELGTNLDDDRFAILHPANCLRLWQECICQLKPGRHPACRFTKCFPACPCGYGRGQGIRRTVPADYNIHT